MFSTYPHLSTIHMGGGRGVGGFIMSSTWTKNAAFSTRYFYYLLNTNGEKIISFKLVGLPPKITAPNSNFTYQKTYF